MTLRDISMASKAILISEREIERNELDVLVASSLN